MVLLIIRFCHPHQLHDFGFRGSSSVESAALGGAAHLVNFQVRNNLESFNHIGPRIVLTPQVADSFMNRCLRYYSMW